MSDYKIYFSKRRRADTGEEFIEFSQEIRDRLFEMKDKPTASINDIRDLLLILFYLITGADKGLDNFINPERTEAYDSETSHLLNSLLDDITKVEEE